MNRQMRRRLAHAKYPVAKIELSSDWHRVDAAYSVRFTVRGHLLNVDWLPSEPTPENHPPVLDFLRLRHAFLQGVAGKIGRPVLCDMGFV